VRLVLALSVSIPEAHAASVSQSLNLQDLECGMTLMTSFPAKRRVSFELDGVNYAATVVLKDVETLQLVSPAIDSSGSR